MLNTIFSPTDRLSSKTKLLGVAAATGICVVVIAIQAFATDGFPLLGFIMLLVSAIVGGGILWRESQSLEQAEKAAKQLADHSKFHAVEANTPLGQAINSIHENEEEAKLKQRELIKKGISEIVVNLARRSQSLVDRQVEVLDELEQSEENPDRLEKLFTIDHLATRMRRNSESLLVLADGEAPKRRGQPVAISDVMRVAVGEVENYQNLQVQTEADSKISAAAAVDLAHLLAELIENASHFSPPDKAVEIIGKFNIDKDYVINVIDHGVGMSEPQRELSNDILANPPELDLGLSRSLGFNVIGRLAKRLGMGTSILDTPGSGVSAVVRIPKSLLVGEKAPEAEAPAAAKAVAPTKVKRKVEKPEAKSPERRKAPGKTAIPQNRDASSDKASTLQKLQGLDSSALKSKSKNKKPAKAKPAIKKTGPKEKLSRRSTDTTPERQPNPTVAPPAKAKPAAKSTAAQETGASALQKKAGDSKVEKPEVQKQAPKETIANKAPAPKKLDEAVPTGESFEQGVDSLLEDNGAPAKLTKRKRGEAKIPLGEGRTIPGAEADTTTAKASARKPEEIQLMLSRYRSGIKGNQETTEGDNNE